MFIINYIKISNTKKRENIWLSFLEKKREVGGGCNTFFVDFPPSSPSMTLIYFLTFKWTNFFLLTIFLPPSLYLSQEEEAIKSKVASLSNSFSYPSTLNGGWKMSTRCEWDEKRRQDFTEKSDSAVNDDKFHHWKNKKKKKIFLFFSFIFLACDFNLIMCRDDTSIRAKWKFFKCNLSKVGNVWKPS